MPRPEAITDLPDSARSVTLGSINVAEMGTNATLLRALAALLDGVRALGGTAEGTSLVTLTRPRTEQEQADQLRMTQSSWDALEKRYLEVAASELSGEPLKPPYQSYEGWQLRRHANNEGYPILDTFAKKEDEK